MDIQRIRNLTTGKLHTDIQHVYEDLELITGQTRLMTHMTTRFLRAVEPWLREHVTEPRFWDGKFDIGHTGEYKLPEPTQDERKAMIARYMEQPNPLEGNPAVTVEVPNG